MRRGNYKEKMQRVRSFCKSIFKRVKMISNEQDYSMKMIRKKYRKIIFMY